MSTPISHPFEKRDLHEGTASAGNALASAVDPLLDASENWMQRMRDLAQSADEFVRENPWQAMGAAVLVGVTIGYTLSRRSYY